MSTVDVLRRTRRVILEQGWTQHELENSTGGVCVLGGLLVAQYGTIDISNPDIWPSGQRWPTGFRSEAAFALVDTCGHECYLSKHNDHCCQNIADVIDWLDRAIALEEDAPLQLGTIEHERVPVLV